MIRLAARVVLKPLPLVEIGFTFVKRTVTKVYERYTQEHREGRGPLRLSCALIPLAAPEVAPLKVFSVSVLC